MPKLEVYQGERLDVMFDGPRCIHSRMCVLGRPDVFVPNADGPWIHPNNAPPEAIMEIAHSCPSGAISYQRKDGGTDEQPPIVNLIRIRENGPYAFHGELNIAGDRHSFRATLCRCGASRNKPYCDGSHSKAGFLASGEPDTHNSEPLAHRDGLLTVTPVPDGPLKVQGAMEIVSGTGRTIDRRNSAFFCRCGASANKPFCDGSHSKVSFTDRNDARRSEAASMSAYGT